MQRYMIVSRPAGVYDGIYYTRRFAEQSIDGLRITWPGLDWEIEPIECELPIPGLMIIGRVQAKRVLKRYQKTLSLQPGNFTDMRG
ncbi:MAG: hypothetical protein KDI16_10705 [Halioglobus sp.]|nr:hypothetical protein [Halioglobus sp.]